MDENLELLEYIYKDANMGTETVTTLIKTIHDKDNKIKKDIEDVLKNYEKYVKKTKKLIEKHKLKVKEESAASKMGAWMGIKTELIKDNSDARIADMLIKGLTMGVIDVSKKIDNFKGDVDNDIIKLASEFKDFQNDSINKLKNYL
jgi:hypothetical protein